MQTDDRLRPCPPFVSVPGLANIRDIGGWPIVNRAGSPIASVRSGLIFRGPDPSPVRADGLAALRDLGISISFDLRSKQQIDRAGGYRGLDGIHRIWCPIFAEEEYTPEKAAVRYQQYSSDGTEGIVQAFSEILTHGNLAFRTILLHIASLPLPPSPSSSILLHCTTGNNRTGVFIGILLSLAGVPRASIAAEYALSQTGLAASRPAVVARLLKNPIFEGSRDRCERMVGAREESMLAMLDAVASTWGGAEGYVRDHCGLSADEVEAVRRVLRVPSPALTSPSFMSPSLIFLSPSFLSLVSFLAVILGASYYFLFSSSP